MKIDFDLFKKVTGYDINKFFIDVNDFLINDYPFILNYYNGGEINSNSFDKLKYLLGEVNIIEPLFRINNNILNTIDFWELLELFSNIQIKLLTIKKLGKWNKTTKLNNFKNSAQINYIQRENETLEKICLDNGEFDNQNSWVNLAVDNQIIEEDYTNNGGLIISVPLNKAYNIEIENIIDYMNNDNILGKDINRKISFIQNDLDIVKYKKALEQSFNIKIEIRKNSIPEFPEYGINNSIIGSNVASISYPSLFRDFLNLFKKDKRWSFVNLLDIYRKDDSVFLKLEAVSILKDSNVTNINI